MDVRFEPRTTCRCVVCPLTVVVLSCLVSLLDCVCSPSAFSSVVVVTVVVVSVVSVRSSGSVGAFAVPVICCERFWKVCVTASPITRPISELVFVFSHSMTIGSPVLVILLHNQPFKPAFYLELLLTDS